MRNEIRRGIFDQLNFVRQSRRKNYSNKKFMKNILIYRFCLAAFFVFGFSFAATAQEAKQTKPVVMIVGAYHMSNPGRDVTNVKADDVLAEKRQREIIEFVALVKRFKPTRIAVEEPSGNAKLNERYARYLAGDYKLTANETDQIGFRLAKDLNHQKIYTVDWQGRFDMDKVLESAAANNQTAVSEGIIKTFKSYGEDFAALMKTATITELFRYLNDEKGIDDRHRPYLTAVRIGKDADYAGADLAAQWYERNLKIYANITRLSESPNERVLVLIGNGHLKLLQQFITDSGDYDLERLGKYL
jgi:hypothetical protein